MSFGIIITRIMPLIGLVRLPLIKMDGMEHLFDLTREVLQGKKDYVADIYQSCLLLSYGGILQA